MRWCVLFFLSATICAHAEWDHLFSEDEDSSLYHHVNVITGNLNLSLQDGVIHGAKSLPLFRTYSSSGALERHWRKLDLDLREERGLLVQGGWSFFPHTNLLIEISTKLSKMRAYLAEPSGNYIEYAHPRRFEDGETGERILKPRLSAGQSSGILSARNNPQNNELFVSIKQGYAILYLPDGGSRKYVGEELGTFRHGSYSRFFYRLVSEKLPSQHEIHYEYDHKKQVKRISVTNPRGDKSYASAYFEIFKKSPPFHFRVTTSDAKSLEYQATLFKERDYLATVKNSASSEEVSLYSPGRKGIGARIEQLTKDGKSQLKVSYYLPPDQKAEKKWVEDPDKKGLQGDKVSMIEAPVGPNGEMQPIARYWYCKEFTDVRDSEGILTRFFHDEHKVLRIVNYDEKGAEHCGTQLLWEGERLRGKAKLTPQGEALLAKTFRYDAAGNVVEEILWGNLTGDAPSRFSFGPNFTFPQAESLSKRFTYDPQFNLPLVQEEEEGPTTRFFYKSGTDLLTLRLTCDHEKIVKREIFEYDADNLLTAEIVDDGSSPNPADLTAITKREIKRYTLDPASGLAQEVRELSYDPESRMELLLKRVELSYSPEKLVTQERVYDATNSYRYTLYTEYEKGRVVRKTTPLGRENVYRYNSLGDLIQSKEVGSPHKHYTLDALGRPFLCIEKDSTGAEKRERSYYDTKGRLLKQIDSRGNATEQFYDGLGRCHQTTFPQMRDDEGEIYSPVARFGYDIQGNLISTTTARGEITETVYNAFRKPVEVRHADGSRLIYRYNKNGTLRTTLYPDGTEIHYTYDLFQRMTSKTVYAKTGQELCRERWEYSTFHLLSYTDPRGLTTEFSYDAAGRKIRENAGGRKKHFFYDALGFLEKTVEGDVAHVQLCDLEGSCVEEWIEEADGRVENWMRFFYDAEGRKEKAIRLTSRGEAVDLFAFDSEGRLTKHTNPEEAVTEFIFTENGENALGQRVQQKISIDPLGNAICETSDATNRPVLLEKKDAQGKVVSREEYFYDRAGNRTKRVTSVFQKNRQIRQLSASWKYDLLGRVIEEVEDGEKITRFTYDEKGRVVKRILASGIVFTHAYDGLDRLTEMKSSDGSVHLLYFYDTGPEPTEIRDLVQKTKLTRRYNLFGQLTLEINPFGHRYAWDYDEHGRVTKFTLPDNSSVTYQYKGDHLVAVERKSPQGRALYAHHYTKFDENGHVYEEGLIHQICGARTIRDLLERPVSFTSLPLRLETSYGPTNLVMETKNSLSGHKSYSYDSLGQLEEEGALHYEFDSVGNPIRCEFGSCNEITSFAGCTLQYDPCGNPLERITSEGQILYTYDALGRLTRITYPNKKEILYSYDPLSRLLSKKTSTYHYGSWQEETFFYLYDQEKEIGTLDTTGQIHELKVLGLGIQGDIGAAVAIELQGKAYAPLHDFQGNIVGLVAPDGTVAESYAITAFGLEKTSSPPRNPWRFSSKRVDEGLVFFGNRFYDPSLGRWLTPDPAGFVDGPNLYLFVLNSPLNRLDLFGFVSEPNFPSAFELNVPLNRVCPPPLKVGTLIQAKAHVGEVEVDCVVSCGHWYKLQFTAEELNAGKVDLVKHMTELVPKDGTQVGLITAQNGIHTSLDKFTKGMCQTIVDKVPEGTLFLGIHLPHEGFMSDIWQAGKEILGKETPRICADRQIFVAALESLHKINPEILLLHIIHSRSGGRHNVLFNGLSPEHKSLLQKHLYILALGPSHPLPREHGFRVYNIYSTEDHVTGWFGILPSFNKSKYDISFVPSSANLWDRLMFRSEHGIMGKTYQEMLRNRMKDIRRDYGFYNDAVR